MPDKDPKFKQNGIFSKIHNGNLRLSEIDADELLDEYLSYPIRDLVLNLLAIKDKIDPVKFGNHLNGAPSKRDRAEKLNFVKLIQEYLEHGIKVEDGYPATTRSED